MSDLLIHHILDTDDLIKLLHEFDGVFNPPLHTKIGDFKSYAMKLISKGNVFVIIKDHQNVGFVAFYSNDYVANIGYLSQIAVMPYCKVKGIGYDLLKIFENFCYGNGMKELKLEVENVNSHAVNFYKRNGYVYLDKASDDSIYMIKK